MAEVYEGFCSQSAERNREGVGLWAYAQPGNTETDRRRYESVYREAWLIKYGHRTHDTHTPHVTKGTPPGTY